MKKTVNVNLKEIEKSLRLWISGARRVVIAGVGNPLRRDDFVGVQIIRNLRNRVSRAVYLIECETVPESFIEPISEFKPTHVLIIDAAMLNLKPGSSKLIEPNKIAGIPISTHALPLRVFCEYLVKTTGAKVVLLAIQPKDTSFGEGLTEEMKEAVKNLTSLLVEILPE